MKSTFIQFCALLITALFYLPSYAAVIDFNTASGSADGYSEQGVTFTKFGTSGGVGFNTVSPSGSQAYYTSEYVKATFSGRASFVSVDMGDFCCVDEDLISLEAFDASGSSLGFTSKLHSKYFSGMSTLSLSVSNIAYVIFGADPSVGRGGVLADNFTFTASPVSAVPVPAAALLFTPALLGLFAIRRKKCNSTDENLHFQAMAVCCHGFFYPYHFRN